jgi:outer membrane protein OmpA-like peptidoglycan-associated protein
MSSLASTSREPEQPLGSWILLALLASLLVHVILFFWLRGVYLDYGAPVVDPIEPKRFNLERATIDPKSLEVEMQNPTGFNPRVTQDPVEIKPEQISAFSGPLKAPSIPTPRLTDPSATPLSAGKVDSPVAAFSALPLSLEGKIPQASQALVGEASTAALAETSKALQGNLAGGPDAKGSIAGLPGARELSDLVKMKDPNALERPGFQPILIRLSSDVLFAFDSAQLKPESEKTLQELAVALGKALRIQVTVEGHTDTVGEDAYNQKLSEDRAMSVATWLKAHSTLDPSHIQSKGFGESRPIANPNGSIEEQARNRRVEIRIEGER